jgi:lipopolysaccharide/colanic/teichoic acid biosynthesis glycosyltransferase
MAAVVIVLATTWNYDGWGLEPLQALLAVSIASAFASGALLASRRWRAPHRVLVVGAGPVADALCAEIGRARQAEVAARLEGADAERLGNEFEGLGRLVSHRSIDSVLVADPGTEDVILAQLVEQCGVLDLHIAIVPRPFEQIDARLARGRIGGVPLLLAGRGKHEGSTAAASRACDCLLAGTLLLLTTPLWLAITLAIVVDEPGPVVYRARRVGHRGREFNMYKFRKMRRDAAGPRLTLQDDDRFTRVGRFLARTKLDELPQLVNVLLGEMALVGPRPEDPSFVAAYPSEFAAITRVRPGITGLSQIQFRDESSLLIGEDFETLYRTTLLPLKMGLDTFYARHRSALLDVRILAWTAVAIVEGATVHADNLTASVRFKRRRHSAERDLVMLGGASQPDVMTDVT